MHNLVISFIGRDCPGVVFAVSGLLEKRGCNIIAASQTILSGEFAAIFIVEAPDKVDAAELGPFLTEDLKKGGMDLSVVARPAIGEGGGVDVNSEPFVITVNGPDRIGLISSISAIFAKYRINIKNMKAMLDDNETGQALFVFEVSVPAGCDLAGLKGELADEARRLGQRVSVQHTDIFEAMHRILPV